MKNISEYRSLLESKLDKNHPNAGETRAWLEAKLLLASKGYQEHEAGKSYYLIHDDGTVLVRTRNGTRKARESVWVEYARRQAANYGSAETWFRRNFLGLKK